MAQARGPARLGFILLLRCVLTHVRPTVTGMEPTDTAPRSATTWAAATARTPLSLEVHGGDPESVAVSGDLDAYSAPELRRVLAEVVDTSEGPIVEVDLSGLTFIDAAGLAVLVGQQRGWLHVAARSCSPASARVSNAC